MTIGVKHAVVELKHLLLNDVLDGLIGKMQVLGVHNAGVAAHVALDKVACWIPGDVENFFTEVGHGPCLVIAAAIDCARQIADHGAESCFTLLERRGHLHLGGDIGMGATDPQRIALFVTADQLAATVNPNPIAVLVTHARITFVVIQIASQMACEQSSGNGHILRVEQVSPVLTVEGPQLFLAVADNGGPTVVDQRLAGFNIPFPGAHVGCLNNARKPSTLVFKGELHLFAGSNIGDEAMPDHIAIFQSLR